MAVSRRTFLRVLGSAAVAAALPKVTLISPPGRGVNPFWESWKAADAAAAGPITFAALEAGYKAACLGRNVPNLAIVSVSVARQFGLVFDVEVDA